MKVKTTHPVTGKTKIVEMTADEYRANKILNPGIRIVEDTPDNCGESVLTATGHNTTNMRKSEIEALIREQKEKTEGKLANCDNPYTTKFYQGLIAGYDYAISLLNI